MANIQKKHASQRKGLRIQKEKEFDKKEKLEENGYDKNPTDVVVVHTDKIFQKGF